MKIEFATNEKDFEYLAENDHHVPPDIIRQKIEQGEVIVIRDEGDLVGWLRYGYFWDLIPFMNMLRIAEDKRGRGLGTKLVAFWESEMKQQGHDRVMTSTLSDEQAQHFYRKLGYKDIGALLLPQEALEIIFLKTLS